MMTRAYFLVKDGRSYSQSVSSEDVKQILIRLIRIELRFLNRLALIVVTIPTELPRIPKQYNTTNILAILTVCSVASYSNTTGKNRTAVPQSSSPHRSHYTN
jgi:hypothetical protein